ncbi:MAG: YbjN domain-containing protein [Actinomycetota bacterium]
MSDLFDDARRVGLERRIDEWLATVHAQHPNVVAAHRAPDETDRWMVRLRGEVKEFTTIWLRLGQRTLRYETYVMPFPDENAAAVFELLLRRNERLVGVHYALGAENAVFLTGELVLSSLDERELDRIIGTLFAAVEAQFDDLVRLGFASRFSSSQ